MKGKLRNLLSIFMLFVLLASTSVFAAAPVETPMAVFDLTAPGVQTQTYQDKEGNLVTIGCEYTPYVQTRGVSKPLVKGGITRVWLTGSLSCEFMMDISPSGKITEAYDEAYTAIGVTVTSDNLAYSSTRATYKLTFQTPVYPILGSSGYLRAAISGDNLILSETIYGLNNFS